MAFSLNRLPRVEMIQKQENSTKKENIKRCYAVIKNQEKITDNIRKALVANLTSRLRRLSTVNLSSDLLKSNIIELLEYCCDEDYANIEVQDVIDNEKDILQQIMWCTEYKNTRKLVWKEEEHIDRSQFSTTLERKKLVTEVSMEDLLKYFDIE